jgi:hypothetical protein
MKPRTLFSTKQASRMLVGGVVLLLIWAAFSAPAWAIVGGKPDGNRHPNVGAVIVRHPLYGVIPYFSGTLIHERVFLTAGHGVASILAGEVELLGVSFDPEVDINLGTWLPVKEIFCDDSPKNGANPGRADIGIFVLEESVRDVIPATLPTVGLLDDLKKARLLDASPRGQKFTVVGYGWGLDWPPPQPIYPISDEGIALRNYAQSGYRALNDAWLVLSQNPATGYGGCLNGDSGGPAFWTDPDTGDETLVSIVAWGGSPVGNSFYFRIDTVESLSFIQDVFDSL